MFNSPLATYWFLVGMLAYVHVLAIGVEARLVLVRVLATAMKVGYKPGMTLT